MYRCLFLALALFGTVRSQVNPGVVVATEPEDGGEWNCSLDHAQHPTNPNLFLQSAIGFDGLTEEQRNTFVFTQRCPVIHQIFNKDNNGFCRCLYSDELQALLEADCTLRAESNEGSDVYSSLNPNRNVTTIAEMWERRSCLEVLRQNQIDGYANLNVQPMFFNESGCKCQWTQAGLDNFIAATGDTRCERLFDYVFDQPRVFGDLVGNWIDMQPFFIQNNFSMQEGGNVFDENVYAAVAWRLSATDFMNFDFITSFRTFDDNNGVPQIIFTNRCEFPGDLGGFVDLRYRSATGTYTLDFLGLTASCQAANRGGPNSIQVVQVSYRVGTVSLTVNNGPCNVDAINNREGSFLPRQGFNDNCPFQIGGRVGTNPLVEGFGELLEPSAKFTGIMFFHTALRNCDDLPFNVASRGGGI